MGGTKGLETAEAAEHVVVVSLVANALTVAVVEMAIVAKRIDDELTLDGTSVLMRGVELLCKELKLL
jgi:hypothetical protein